MLHDFELVWPGRTFLTREQPVRVPSSSRPFSSPTHSSLSLSSIRYHSFSLFLSPARLALSRRSTVLKPRRLCLQLGTNRQRIITGQRVFNLPYTFLPRFDTAILSIRSLLIAALDANNDDAAIAIAIIVAAETLDATTSSASLSEQAPFRVFKPVPPLTWLTSPVCYPRDVPRRNGDTTFVGPARERFTQRARFQRASSSKRRRKYFGRLVFLERERMTYIMKEILRKHSRSHSSNNFACVSD